MLYRGAAISRGVTEVAVFPFTNNEFRRSKSMLDQRVDAAPSSVPPDPSRQMRRSNASVPSSSTPLLDRSTAGGKHIWQHSESSGSNRPEAEEAQDNALLRAVLRSHCSEPALLYGLQGLLQHGRRHSVRSVHDHRCTQSLPHPLPNGLTHGPEPGCGRLRSCDARVRHPYTAVKEPA
jgi:hypothetical protein